MVFLVHGDPIASGDVSSLARPGGNITGSAQMLTELSSKQLDLLKQDFPGISRVSVLWNAGNHAKLSDWNEVNKAARALAVTLQSREVRRPEDFESALIGMKRDRPDALMTLVDPLTYQLSVSPRRRLRGQDLTRRQTGRPPDRAGHQIRTRHQPQDRQDPRPHRSALAAGAGGSGD
jgi:hypothetical protein